MEIIRSVETIRGKIRISFESGWQVWLRRNEDPGFPLAEGTAVDRESFLAYIGLGIKPPEPSIGILLSTGQGVLLQYPYQTFFPAVLISVLMIAFNMLSNGLRDAMDPNHRGEE